jgi:RHS repeat-associated protein
MAGDGLTDLVRIRNGSVCYWPNLGYGRFGAKVEMGGETRFDYPEQFDPRRIRLADVDGSGTTDLLYLHRDGVRIYGNQAGNGLAPPIQLPDFPDASDHSAVATVDLLGSGTTCLVWSSALPGSAFRSIRYIDLLGSKKPHLLTSYRNNLGLEAKLEYASSTKFYLEDAAAGRSWVTRLSFPVHVLTRIETWDAISRHRFVSTYAYHHGYFDGLEREFRGFGLVEQRDTESFSKFSGAGTLPLPANADPELHLPPVLTRTWFHNGAWLDASRIARHYAHEYYAGDAQAQLLPDTILPPGLSSDEAREACRALKGQILRQETFAEDGSPLAPHPYLVSERSYEVRRLQPSSDQRHAVFFVHPREAIEYHYERNPADPRITHAVTLEVDDFGAVRRSAAIGYPRRAARALYDEQKRIAITLTEADVFHHAPAMAPGGYRLGVPIETRTFELTGLAPVPDTLLSFDAVFAAVNGAMAIPYEAVPGGSVQKRLLSQARSLYSRDDLSGPLPFGQVELLALSWQSYVKAFTPALIADVLQGRATDAILREGGYVKLDGDDAWWIPSGRQVFAPDQFYLPVAFLDRFGNSTAIAYDHHRLAVVQATDPVGNTTAASHDYRVVAPAEVVDPNGNRVQARFDALGLVVATAVMGKPGSTDGDTLADPTTTFDYDLDRFRSTGKPAVAHARAREQHAAANTRWQDSYSYSDGSGREVMKKVQAEPGNTGAPRWVGTGRTVLDNKGHPVKQYEPYFSATAEYEDEPEIVEQGVTPVLRYDSLGRLVRTDLPDGTFSTVIFDPWSETRSDANDTVLDSAWYRERQAPGTSPEHQRAARLAAAHASTPTVVQLDALGRIFLTVEDNGPAGKYETRVALDIEGNPLTITDARGVLAMQHRFAMGGHKLWQNSCDAGARWMLADAGGATLRAWDSRDHELRHVYDELRRPRQLFVKTVGGAEALVEQVIYGESYGQSPADGAALNLLTRIYQSYDGAGIATNTRYDFKGNLLEGTRQLLRDLVGAPSWTAQPPLANEIFTSSRRYDALNRPVQGIAPHSSAPGTRFDVIQPTYNEANLLERLDVWQQQATAPTALLDGASATLHAVTNVDYDAKGQRVLIEYGSGVETRYSYDPKTFRLSNTTTLRPRDHLVLQDLSYTSDPVGNITHIQDDADIQGVVYFKNRRVEPSASYVYDALYRLVSATGREHLGQTGNQQNAPQQVIDNDGFRSGMLLPGDGNAMGRYTETYSYDAVGNLLAMAHGAASGSWTRRYAYNEPSAIEPMKSGNRLSATSLPGDSDGGPYSAVYSNYDAHGNMGAMPHLAALDWNFKDQLAAVNLGGGGACSYSYDAAGQRVRKLWQKSATLSEERISLNGWEIFRRRSGGAVIVERQTLHLFDGASRIAVVETTTVDDGAPPAALVRYQLGNHLDTALLDLDDHGDVISYEEYYPFGSTSYQAGRSLAEVSLKRYRHVAKERDDETGLYYYGARYYAPWLGRWTSCDPEHLKDGLSVYVYTRNRPVTLVDIGGHDSAPPFISRYLSDVLPPIMSVLNKHKIPPDRAIWLVVQAWSEQGPSKGLPSKADNRIFNQQFTLKDLKGKYSDAEIADIDTRLKKGEIVDLGGGVKVRNILQNESTDLANPKLKVSPTYFYDSLEASVEHHLSMLSTRFSSASGDLSDSSKTVQDFFGHLHRYGHVPDAAQLAERKVLVDAGKPLEEKHMFYDEVVLQKRLGTVTDNLKKWDMKELDAKLTGMYNAVDTMVRDLAALRDEYKELYKQFEQTGDADIADQLAANKAEQATLAKTAKAAMAEADALLAIRDQLAAEIKKLP